MSIVLWRRNKLSVNGKKMEKCWGEFDSPWWYFWQKLKSKMQKKRMSLAWCKSMKWLKKHFLLEKEPVLRKKGSGEKSSAEEGRDDINTTIRR